MVGNVLVASPDLTTLGPYIPTFYQHGDRVSWESVVMSHFCVASVSLFFIFLPQNSLVQQPLAHIYFLTVLEHLQMKKHRPNHLCRLAENIAKASRLLLLTLKSCCKNWDRKNLKALFSLVKSFEFYRNGMLGKMHW